MRRRNSLTAFPLSAVVQRHQFVNHDTGVRVRAVTFTSLSIAGDSATIQGSCTSDGAPCTFVLTVSDGGAPGGGDSVSGGAPAGGTLRGGNIRIAE